MFSLHNTLSSVEHWTLCTDGTECKLEVLALVQKKCDWAWVKGKILLKSHDFLLLQVDVGSFLSLVSSLGMRLGLSSTFPQNMKF